MYILRIFLKQRQDRDGAVGWGVQYSRERNRDKKGCKNKGDRISDGVKQIEKKRTIKKVLIFLSSYILKYWNNDHGGSERED